MSHIHEELASPTAATVISSAVDARPMLERSPENVWERSEQVRSRLYDQLEEECRRRGMEALVLQSGPYVHPAWVKFEAWRPRTERTLTARSTLTITINTLPFHRFESIYRVDWQHLGFSGTVDDLHTLPGGVLGSVLEVLCDDRPDADMLGISSRVRRLLRPLQLRKAWWQLWRPRNRVAALRRDWLPVAGVGTMLLGVTAVMTTVGPGQEAALYDPSVELYLPDPITAPLAAPQIDPTTGAAVLAPNQPASGYLGEGSNRYSDGTPYEMWSFTATAGETIRATVISSDFDAMLSLGQMGYAGFEELAFNDDDADSNPVIDWTAPADGSYLLVARPYSSLASGGYTIQVASAAAATLDAAAPATASAALADDPLVADQAEAVDLRSATMGLGGLVFFIGLLATIAAARAPRLVRSSGKPMAEPRILHYLDSWQTVVFGAGDAEPLVRQRMIDRLTSAGDRFHCGVERIWDWGLDGKTEREQIVLRLGRALVFTQIHRYGDDLYVGWDAQMNLGTWREKPLGSGIDRESGRRIRLQTVEQTLQRTTEYDLIDLNCLAEWTHAQVTQLLKQFLKERQIDQEIDFSIIRGERKGLTQNREEKAKRGPLFRRAG